MKPYVHRRLRPGALAPLLVLPLAAVVTTVIDRQAFLAIFVAMALYNLWTSSLLLRVDHDGMVLRRGRANGRYRDMRVPWLSIDAVMLDSSDPPQLTVRLREGAPLPPGVRGAIHDPRTHSVTVGDLVRPVPGVDPIALDGALQRFGRLPLVRH